MFCNKFTDSYVRYVRYIPYNIAAKRSNIVGFGTWWLTEQKCYALFCAHRAIFARFAIHVKNTQYYDCVICCPCVLCSLYVLKIDQAFYVKVIVSTMLATFVILVYVKNNPQYEYTKHCISSGNYVCYVYQNSEHCFVRRE